MYKTLATTMFLATMLIGWVGQFSSIGTAQELPDAKTIIEKHLTATGPVEKMKDVKGVVTEATMTMAGAFGEMKASVKSKQMNGKAVIVIDMDEIGEMKQGTDGNVFWAINPMTGAQLVNKEDLGATAEEMGKPFPALNWLNSLDKIEVAGVEDVDGKPCYELRFKDGGQVTKRFFDKESMLILKTVSTNPMAGEVEVFTSDYRKVGEFILPFKTVTAMPQGEMTMTVNKIDFDAKLTDADFELPKEVKALIGK